MKEPNDLLRRARERLASPHVNGHASRQELAELVNTWVYANTGRAVHLNAHYVGQLERGEIRWPQDPDRRAGLRAVLGVRTDAELGFRRPRRSDPVTVTVDDVDRKNFLRVGLGVAAAAVTAPLAELLTPTQAFATPNTVARAHIDDILTAHQMFSRYHHHHGGGDLARRAIATQLEHCGALLRARVPDRLRPELYSAVCRLSHTAGFMAFDVGDHRDARRLFQFALACAEESGDWHLRAAVLSNMARQSWWLGDYDMALTDFEQALVRADRLIPRVRAMLHAGRARALSNLGRHQEALAAVGKADDEFAHSDRLNDPGYCSWYKGAEHSSETGHALADLGDIGQHQATIRLGDAISHYGDDYPRSRAFARIRLATATMTNGDPHHAVTIAADAVTAAATIHSTRLTHALNELHQAAATHQRMPDVAQLRHSIATLPK